MALSSDDTGEATVPASVTILDKSLPRLNELDMQFGPTLNTIFSTMDSIEEHVLGADLVIGAVLIPGAAAPRLVTADMVKKMRRGAVMVDVAIDQGGCVETCRPTTHSDPTFIVDDVVHYCVTNMPAVVSRTSSVALNNATLPFVMELANKGYRRASHENVHFRAGLNVHHGDVTHGAVVKALGLPHRHAEDAIQP